MTELQLRDQAFLIFMTKDNETNLTKYFSQKVLKCYFSYQSPTKQHKTPLEIFQKLD